ncbi:recombination mediator RecR [uncultured Helcococcus sp.]|uniref:recombination mediator RecR n=1 Tax=uncultured Helcococcus sp. TaxID=1072508 RepID=UPI00288B4F54|nr:recombination mediator RecR [uncultured Helcococcus sp.]
MKEYPESIEELIENLRKLPSVGRKSAQRMALHVVNMDKNNIESIIKAFQDVKDKIKKCQICGNFTEDSICQICKDSNRDKSTICVVEDVTNLITIEKSNSFNGTYHVLNGLINPGAAISNDTSDIDRLVDRIKNEDIKELIFAISPTLEGETTMLFIRELVKNKDIKITRIASGIPIGGNLEYFDELTLSKALEDRRDLG